LQLSGGRFPIAGNRPQISTRNFAFRIFASAISGSCISASASHSEKFRSSKFRQSALLAVEFRLDFPALMHRGRAAFAVLHESKLIEAKLAHVEISALDALPSPRFVYRPVFAGLPALRFRANSGFLYPGRETVASRYRSRHRG
jgi:hypothetical protein